MRARIVGFFSPWVRGAQLGRPTSSQSWNVGNAGYRGSGPHLWSGEDGSALLTEPGGDAVGFLLERCGV